jgi:hypothetical protein
MAKTPARKQKTKQPNKQLDKQRSGTASSVAAIQAQPERFLSDKEYTGNIVVHFIDGAVKPEIPGDSLIEFADKQGLTELVAFLKNNQLDDPDRSHRLVQSTPVPELLEMEKIAEHSDFPPIRSLTGYWRINASNRPDEEIERLVKELSIKGNTYKIDEAYREHNITLAATVTPDTLSTDQGYLDPYPVGIDARYTWPLPNGAGEGINFVDLEMAWEQSHVDLPATVMLPGHQNLRVVNSDAANHGTAVIGIVAARDNVQGIVGIAPNVQPIRLASSHRQNPRGDWIPDHANRIVEVIRLSAPYLSAGDVLLLEIQVAVTNLPVEIDETSGTRSAVFHAIRLASALNVIVIEPAGNGNSNTRTDFDVGQAPLQDSGAIMVGASERAVTGNAPNRAHGRWVVPERPIPIIGSNYGARVNCYAWGEGVTTCGCDYPTAPSSCQANTAYTNTFGGTSAASAIVAGAALVVQGLYAARNPGVRARLSVRQMRDALSTYGTPSVGNEIGVMPNLRAIVDRLMPDAYIRDAVGDLGETPYVGGRLSASPDIIVRKSNLAGNDPVPSPMMTFGPNTANRDDLGSEVELGQDNFIYVRMKNRGNISIPSATATVYWANAATLITPDQWTRIGQTASVMVPQGSGIAVTPGLRWRAADLPPPGHYCFIAVLDGVSDPAPVLPPNANFGMAEFVNLIRNNNNVAWRNFNVVNTVSDMRGMARFGFFIAGGPREEAEFNFEIFLEGAEKEGAPLMWLDVPKALAKAIDFANKLERDNKIDELGANYVRFKLPISSSSTRLTQVMLEAKSRHKCFIRFKAEEMQRESRVIVRQLYKEVSVGQVTWLIRNKSGSKPRRPRMDAVKPASATKAAPKMRVEQLNKKPTPRKRKN